MGENSALTLLIEKKELLQKVFDETKDTVFVGDDLDGSRFVELFEKRDSLFLRLYEIDEQLKDKSVSDKEAETEIKRIKTIVSGIIRLDRESEPYRKKAMSSLKDTIKGINVGRSLSEGYTQSVFGNSGAYFDTTN